MPNFDPTVIPLFTGAGAFIYAFLYLLRRGDSQQRENYTQLMAQRDEWRARAEEAETRVHQIEVDYDTYRAEQQDRRHTLINEKASLEAELDLCRRRLRSSDAGTAPEKPDTLGGIP